MCSRKKEKKNFFSLCGLVQKANVSDDLVTPGGRFITLISANRVSSHSSNVGGEDRPQARH